MVISNKETFTPAVQVRCGLTAFYPILNTMSLCISGLLSRAASSKEQVPLRFTTDSRLPMVFRGSGDGAPNLYCGDLSHGAYNVALVSKLPLLQSNSMLSQQTRFHAFLTGHAHRNDGLDLKFDQLRNYLGIGVIGRVSDIGRFELNYTVPLGAGKDTTICSLLPGHTVHSVITVRIQIHIS